MAVISVGITVYDGIQTDIQRGYNTGRIISNAATNAVIYGGLTIGIGLITSKIGAVIGSVVPGLGNVVGALAGFAIGTAIGFLLDLNVNGKSIIDHINDAVYNFWTWLFGG